MQLVFNSSPLIFLSKLNYLSPFIESPDRFYVPQSVANEISAKSDPATQTIQSLITSGNLQVQASSLVPLVDSLTQRLGRGESEAIALGIELTADYVLLDDSPARKEARRLGLNVKGTLAVIRKLGNDGKISLKALISFINDSRKLNLESNGLCLTRSLWIDSSTCPSAKKTKTLLPPHEPSAERNLRAVLESTRTGN